MIRLAAFFWRRLHGPICWVLGEHDDVPMVTDDRGLRGLFCRRCGRTSWTGRA